MGTFSIQDELIHLLKQKTPAGKNTVDFLTTIIPMSKEAAYRRLRGEISFSLDETVRLCEKTNTSLDALIRFNRKDIFTFHLSPILPTNSIIEYYKMLEEVTMAMNMIKHCPDNIMYMAQNTLPMEFTYKYKNLSKIYLLKWIYQMQEQENFTCFTEIDVPEKIIIKQKEYASIFQELNSVLLVDKYCFSNFISDIKYFYSINLISKDYIAEIKKEVLSTLNDLGTIAANGYFPNGKKATIYVSHVFFDASYTYIQGGGFQASAIRLYGINNLSCENKKICQDQKIWIESLIHHSTLISGSGGIHRTEYLKAQREIVNSL